VKFLLCQFQEADLIKLFAVLESQLRFEDCYIDGIVEVDFRKLGRNGCEKGINMLLDMGYRRRFNLYHLRRHGFCTCRQNGQAQDENPFESSQKTPPKNEKATNPQIFQVFVNSGSPKAKLDYTSSAIESTPRWIIETPSPEESQ